MSRSSFDLRSSKLNLYLYKLCQHTQISCQIFIQKIADRASERSSDLTTISTQMTHHWQHEHQYQLNSSSRSFAFSFCYAFSPPHPVVVVVFLFFFFLGIWRLLIALASHFKAILPMCRSSIGWSCQFLLLLSSSPPRSLPHCAIASAAH